MSELTVERLRALVQYHPITGEFTWAYNGRGPCVVGKRAGSIENSRGKQYWSLRLDGQPYRAHQLAWLYIYGRWPQDEIDHVDGNGLDNRLENLREVSRAQNQRNQRLHKTNKSGYPGVSWNKESGKWMASVFENGKHKYLGRFQDKQAAIEAAKNARIQSGFHPNHGTRRPL